MRLESHPLCGHGSGAAPHHGRIDCGPVGGESVLSGGHRHPAARTGRDGAGRRGGRRPPLLRRDRRVLARLGALARHPVRVAGRRDPLGDHAAAQCVRRHGGDRRGDDDLHSRSAGQRQELGLPPLLAARRVLRGQCPQPTRGHPYHGALSRLHRQRGGRLGRRPAAARLWPHRPGGPRRAVDRFPARLSRHGPGAGRESGVPAGAARRLWRGHPRRHPRVLRPPPGATRRRRPVPSARNARGPRRASVRPAGRWALGAARQTARAHLLQRDVLGRVRPPGENRRASGAGRACGVLDRPGRAHPRGDRRAVLERRARQLRRHDGWRYAGREPAAAERARLPGGRRPALRGHRDRHRARAATRRLHSPICRAGRLRNAGERLSGLHLLVHQRALRHRTARRGAGAVRKRARLLQPPRPARRARGSAHPGAVGQLRPDLQHGRPHRLGDPAVAAVGSGATPFVHPNPSCVGYSPPPARRRKSTTSYFSVILPVA